MFFVRKSALIDKIFRELGYRVPERTFAKITPYLEYELVDGGRKRDFDEESVDAFIASVKSIVRKPSTFKGVLDILDRERSREAFKRELSTSEEDERTQAEAKVRVTG